MLHQLDELPKDILTVPARELYRVLPGPTLVHLPGRREQPLFVSTLLHGNEDTGLAAIQSLLSAMEGKELPRALSIFFGNVEAARQNRRRLDNQLDYNRIWTGPGDSPEHRMMRQILKEMASRKVFASVDIHNNTGLNPHYGCVNRLDHRFFHLATLFGRTVVYFIRPAGVQSMAFAELCPAVTLECGQVGEEEGIRHAMEFLHSCLHLSEIPDHPIAPHDIALFHTVATLKVPPGASFGFGKTKAEFVFDRDLDHLNFHEIPAGTLLGHCGGKGDRRLMVTDENGRDVGERYLDYGGGLIRTKAPVMPSMLTLNREVILQDCLGYFMERMALPPVP